MNFFKLTGDITQVETTYHHTGEAVAENRNDVPAR